MLAIVFVLTLFAARLVQLQGLEAGRYREACGHPLYEVHPELSFGAMAGAPLAHSKHTAAGRDLRRGLLGQAGLVVPRISLAPVTDTLDAAVVAQASGCEGAEKM